MGRYVYEAGKVQDAIAELNNALSAIAEVTNEFKKAVSTISSARGAQYIDVGFGELYSLQEQAETVIETDINTIQSKVQAIEDYNNAGFIEKIFASAGMTLSKFTEGIFSGAEDILDGGVSIVGFVGGLFSSDLRDACGEFVKKDHVGDWFAKQYESGEGLFGNINKYSYFSHTSTAANILKGIGTAAPYIALSATGVGLTTEVTAAALSGIGQGTEEGLQAGKTFNSAFASGLWQGTKNAALVYTMSKLSQGAQARAAGREGEIIAGSADDFAKFTSGNADEVASAAKKMFNSTDDLIATKLPNGGYRLNSTKTLEAVGDITTDGTKVIARSFGNSGTAQATRVLTNTSDDILYNTIKNTDDLAKQSVDDLLNNTTTRMTRSEKIFQGAHDKVADNKLGKALDKTDDFIEGVGNKVANTKPGKWVSNKIANNKLVQGITNSKPVQAVVNAAAKHPGTAFTATAGVYTLDQIGHADAGTQYRINQAELPTAHQIENPPIPPDGLPEPVTPDPDPVTPDPDPVTPDPDPVTPDPVPVTPDPVPVTPDPDPVTPDPDPGTPDPVTPDPVPGIPDPGTPDPGTPDPGTPDPGTPNPGGGNQGGGGFNNGGYTGESNNPTDPNAGNQVGDLVDEENVSGSLSDLIGGNEYVDIPTSSTPISDNGTPHTKKSVIPVIAGLGAATVAGIGTKAYLDKREQGDDEEEEEFETESWDGDEQMDLGYDTENTDTDDRDYLNPTDEYAYQEDQPESYQAVNSSELASMQ